MKCIVNAEGKILLKVAEFKAVMKIKLPKIVHVAFDAKQQRASAAYKVTAPGSGVFYCLENIKGHRFYYNRLGHNINPKFK